VQSFPNQTIKKKKKNESLIWAKHKEPQTQLLKSFFLEEAPVIHYKLNTSYCFASLFSYFSWAVWQPKYVFCFIFAMVFI